MAHWKGAASQSGGPVLYFAPSQFRKRPLFWTVNILPQSPKRDALRKRVQLYRGENIPLTLGATRTPQHPNPHILLEDKMPPKFLYKYQTVNERSLENLSKCQIFFNQPSNFDDPYDCALHINKSITDEDITQLWGAWKKRTVLFGLDFNTYSFQYQTNGKPNKRFIPKVSRFSVSCVI